MLLCLLLLPSVIYVTFERVVILQVRPDQSDCKGLRVHRDLLDQQDNLVHLEPLDRQDLQVNKPAQQI